MVYAIKTNALTHLFIINDLPCILKKESGVASLQFRNQCFLFAYWLLPKARVTNLHQAVRFMHLPSALERKLYSRLNYFISILISCLSINFQTFYHCFDLPEFLLLPKDLSLLE